MVNLLAAGMMEWAAISSAVLLLALVLFFWIFYSWGKARGKAEAYENVLKGRKVEVKEQAEERKAEEKK